MHQAISIDQLKKTSFFAAAIRELDEKNVSSRQELVDQLKANAKSLPQETAVLEAEQRKLEEEREATRLRAIAIEGRLVDIRQQIHRIMNRGDAARRLARDRLMAGADQRIYTFMVWAQRAGNLADFASHQPIAGSLGVGQEDLDVIYKKAGAAARRVGVRVAESLKRAEQMVLEAQSADEIGLELASMAAGIYQEYVKVPGVRAFPENYEARLF